MKYILSMVLGVTFLVCSGAGITSDLLDEPGMEPLVNYYVAVAPIMVDKMGSEENYIQKSVLFDQVLHACSTKAAIEGQMLDHHAFLNHRAASLIALFMYFDEMPLDLAVGETEIILTDNEKITNMVRLVAEMTDAQTVALAETCEVYKVANEKLESKLK